MRTTFGESAVRALTALLAAACAAAAQAQTVLSYDIEDLGVLSGDEESLAVALNSSGKAVGRSRVIGGFFKAVYWSGTTPADLAAIIGEQTSLASGINDAGHLTTLAGFSSSTSTTGTTAHFWNGTSLTDIGAIGAGVPSSLPRSVGNDISNSDQVVGRAWTSSSGTGEYRAFSWQGGVLKDLGGLAGCTESEALGVNNNGQIVGVASGGICLPTQGVVWASKDAAPVAINAALASAGISDNIVRAYDVNDSGAVLVQRVAAGKGRCVIFKPLPSPTVTDISFIGANGVLETCVPGRINSFGEVVATQSGAPDSSALLYSDGMLHDLNSLVAPSSSGLWNLTAAYDINDAGTIVGQGRINGELHAFRATRVSSTNGVVAIEDSIAPAGDKSVPFGQVTIGVGSTATVTVVNGTNAAVVVDITDSLAAPFGIADPQDCKVTLAARTSCTVTVTFDPVALTAATDSFTFTIDGAPTPVAVSGSGRAASFTVTDSIAPADDLLVPFGGTVQVGGLGTATITVRNNDVVPITVALTQDFAAGPFRLQNAAACNLTLAPNQSCDMVAVFEPTAAGAFTGTFRVSAGAGTEKTITVTGAPGLPNADVELTQSADRTVLQPGVAGSDTAVVTFTLRNNGPDSAGTSVANVLPAGLAYVSHNASAGAYDSSTGRWAAGAVASGATVTLALTVRATAPGAGCLVNAATASGAPAVDPVPANNQSSLTLAAPACVSLRILTAPDSVTSQVGRGSYTTVSHTVDIRNDGPSTARNVKLRLTRLDIVPPAAGTRPADIASILVDGGTILAGTSQRLTVVYDILGGPPAASRDVNFELQVSADEPEITTADNSFEGSYIVTPGTGDGNTSDCFVATAAYGSYLEPHVMVLRRFRDQVLLQSSWGRAFVGWYYRTSPPIADWIRERPWARAVVRSLLTPLVYGLQYPLPGGLLLMLMWIQLTRRMRTTPDAR